MPQKWMTSSPPVPPLNHRKNSNPVYIPLCQNYFLSFSLNWAGKNWVLFLPIWSSMVLDICCFSVTQSCLTLCDPMNCSMPGLSVPDDHPQFAQVHDHCISDAIQAISSSDILFSFCPQSFPASRIFPVNQLFPSDDQNTGASTSASVFPTSIQDWFPLSLTSLISLLSRGLSGVFSSTTVQRHQLFGILSTLWSSSHKHTWALGTP